MNEMPDSEKQKGVSGGNVFSLFFLGITSLVYAYSPDGFGGANLINHIQAIITVVASFNLLIRLG